MIRTKTLHLHDSNSFSFVAIQVPFRFAGVIHIELTWVLYSVLLVHLSVRSKQKQVRQSDGCRASALYCGDRHNPVGATITRKGRHELSNISNDVAQKIKYVTSKSGQQKINI